MPENARKEAVHIRWMIRRDLPEVLKIEADSFEFPWSESQFLDVLQQRNCIGMVAERGYRVVGFFIFELFKSRIQLMNLAVESARRGKGVGSAMIEKLKAKLSDRRRTRIVTEVRETNVNAQVFFRKHNFRAVSVLRRFWDDTDEDAYQFEYWHPGEPPNAFL